MLSNYIVELKNRTGLSYKSLAKEMDIKYTTLINIRDGVVKNISLTILEKLSIYENRNPIDILYEILYKDNEEELMMKHSKESLLLLCKLYLSNYSIDTIYTGNDPVFDNVAQFEGFAYRKASAPNSLVIDSWNRLIKAYLAQYNTDIMMSFKNDKAFLYNVYMYAVGKFFNCTTDEIKRYYIVTDDINVYKTIKKFHVKGASTHVVPLLIRNIDDLDVIQEII